MDSIFNICKSGACGITITGLEKDNDEYLSEDTDIVISTRNYAYSHSVTIDAITSITSDGIETLKANEIVLHNTEGIDEATIEMPIDGLYEVTHIILPTEVWLQYVLDRDVTALTAYNLIYYYNTVSEVFMKYIDGISTEVTLTEILAVNAVPPVDVTEKTSTIIRSDKNTFCTCYLNECFYTVCKNLLTILPNTCTNKLNDLKLPIYNRDILWMALNVIKYLIELQQYFEAQRILENISQCSGLCSTTTLSTNGGGISCGCSS